jgi:hypothetical protein
MAQYLFSGSADGGTTKYQRAWDASLLCEKQRNPHIESFWRYYQQGSCLTSAHAVVVLSKSGLIGQVINKHNGGPYSAYPFHSTSDAMRCDAASSSSTARGRILTRCCCCCCCCCKASPFSMCWHVACRVMHGHGAWSVHPCGTQREIRHRHLLPTPGELKREEGGVASFCAWLLVCLVVQDSDETIFANLAGMGGVFECARMCNSMMACTT